MIKALKIGNVTLPNNLILAPMAGVTDLPFRLLCKEQGAGLLCMEMVSAKAIMYKNRNTQSLLEIDPRENPVSLQFLVWKSFPRRINLLFTVQERSRSSYPSRSTLQRTLPVYRANMCR